MPTPGQTDAQGYTWNGLAWVNPKTGFAKGDEANTDARAVWLKYNHPEDYNKWVASGADLNTIPRKSDFGIAGTITNIWRGAGNVIGKGPSNIPGVKNIPGIGVLWGLTPFQSLGRGMAAGMNREYGKMAENLGMAGIQAATLGGSQAAKGALGPGMQQAVTATAGIPIVGAAVTRPILAPLVFSTAGSLIGLGGNQEKKVQAQGTASSVLPGRATTVPGILTPEQQAQVAAANQNRTDASGSSGPGGGRAWVDWRDYFILKGETPERAADLARKYAQAGQVIQINAPEWAKELETSRAGGGAGAGTTGTTQPKAPGLLPLTPEQLDLIGQQRLAAEKAYDELLNMQKMQKSQAQQQYTQGIQELQRQAAGQAEDISGSLAAAGLDISPASAFGAEQMVQAPLVSGSLAARKGLDQYLANLVEQQKKAKAQKDMTMLDIKKQELQQRAKNTLDQQISAYGGMLGR